MVFRAASIQSLIRRIWALITMRPSLSLAYIQGAFFARTSRIFHQKRYHELSSYEIPITQAINYVANTSEIEANELKAEIDRINAYLGKTKDVIETADPALCRIIYTLIRLKKPHFIIETGVYIGVSSLFILKALEANGSGNLQSIDLPELDHARRVEVGYIVPKNIRVRWKIHRGPSQDLLPRILETVEEIQIYLHDGHHSYKFMLSEYRQAWEKLTVGGILLSDDVHHNDAFLDFCHGKQKNPLIIRKERTHVRGYIGMLIK